MYYANSTVVHPKELYLPNCNSPCSLTKFGVAVKDVIIHDFEKLCQDKNE